MRLEITRLGVKIDQLCFDALGFDDQRVVETTLLLNPGLAEVLARNGHDIPLGRIIMLPDPASLIPRDTSIKLWD